MSWDVRGKTIVITGATDGIGLAASPELAKRGARVLMVGRNPEKTAAAEAEVKRRSGSAEVSSLLCEFAFQSAIRRLAGQILERCERIDVLVNNAGGVNKKRWLTEEGIEATFTVNHLGYFLLTRLLLERLVASAPARVVCVASIGHRQGTIDFDDLGFEKGYAIMKAYCRSKLANVLFANELARRLAGTGVTVDSLHPGTVATNIWSGAPGWAKLLLALFARPFFISPEKGAARIVQLAAAPELEGSTGNYFEDGKIVWPSRKAQDEAVARRLWQVSSELVGLPAD